MKGKDPKEGGAVSRCTGEGVSVSKGDWCRATYFTDVIHKRSPR